MVLSDLAGNSEQTGRERSNQALTTNPLSNNKFSNKFQANNEVQKNIIDDTVQHQIGSKTQEDWENLKNAKALSIELPILMKSDVSQIELLEAMDRYLAVLVNQSELYSVNS